jgi:flagellin
MAATINTNLISLNAQRNLSSTNSALATAIQRLSSGLRVNSAKDDAAGLAIAERMSSQVRGMNVAIRNANDGISLAQTADGALSQITEMAQRMRELAVQSMNATNSTSDRTKLDTEYQQLASEMSRTLNNTAFNGTSILANTSASTLTFQIGAGTTSNDQISIATANLSSNSTMQAVLSSSNGGILSVSSASAAVTNIDTLLETVNTERAVYGAAQNRLSATIATLQVAVESQSAARSRIMDADFAAETANLTRAQVLQQAGTAMLSQANSTTNNVASLLRNL